MFVLWVSQDICTKTLDFNPEPDFIPVDPDEDSIEFSTTTFGGTRLVTDTDPTRLNLPEIRFKIIASDGELEDYQTMTVFRADWLWRRLKKEVCY